MPAPASLPPIPPNIGSIAASQLIGSLLNYLLYGILAVQVYIYRISFPNDKSSIKWMVYLIFLVETVATALNGVDVYYWFAAGFGNIIQFPQPRTSPFYTPILGSLMALVVQVFFCYRIYIINRKALPLSVFISMISLLQAAGGLGGGISSFLSSSDVSFKNRQTFAYLWLIGEAVADVFIAVTMSYLLIKAGNQQHRQTNDIVKRIVRLTVETNAASTIVAIISLGLFYGAPNTTYFICPTVVLAKIYANTLLVTFNNRAFIRPGGSTAHSASMSDSYQSRSQSRSLPFSAGLGLNSESETATLSGSRLGKVSVTTHTESYTLDRLEAAGGRDKGSMV